MSTGGLDPDPPDPGATEPSLLTQMLTRRGGASYVPVADLERYLASQGAAPLADLCDALEHERKVSAAWRARSEALIASAEAIDINDMSAAYDADVRVAAAEATIRALGIDPEAP